MISVAMLGGGRAAAAYYLQRTADCEPADRDRGGAEPAGRWCGHGASALGLDGPMTGDDARAAFTGLLDGQLPDGTVVAGPVPRTDPRSLLPADPLVRELRRAAQEAGMCVAALFADESLAATADDLTSHVSPDGGRPESRVDVRTIADIANAAGLNPHVLYPAGRSAGGFATAFRHAGKKVDVRRCGLDAVFSAPKSVSVLHGLADPQTAHSVAEAHHRAVDAALGYLERHTAHGLRGRQSGGRRSRRIATDGFVAAAFTHYSSRADDPHLHTHIVIVNRLHGEDGSWSAVDSRAVHRHARTAGCVYQAVLRGELTQALGIEWGPVRKGVAEISGIPRPLTVAFSTRRQDIDAELNRTGSSGRKAAQRALFRTRPAKTHTPQSSLREQWAERTRELGLDPYPLAAGTLHRQRPPTPPTAESVAVQLFGPAGLTQHATSFDRRDVIQALTEVLPAGLPVSAPQLESAADWMLRNPGAVRLLDPTEAGDGGRWSTPELLAAERRALSLADKSTAVPAHATPDAAALAATARLSAEQQQLVVGLLTSRDLVDVVVGPAGSGKTAALRVAARAWQRTGVPVVGCALAAVSARRLEAATGIAATSVARLLGELDAADPAVAPSGALGPRTVVVVDEAGMVGTRDLAALTSHVAAARGKLVLVGDPAQLPEIDAGGLFAALARRAHPLTTNQRQEQAWERAALLALRDGAADRALDAYLAHGRVHVAADAASTTAALAAAYVEHLDGGRSAFDVVALTSTRRDAAELNDAIRARLHSAGLLDADGASAPSDDGIRRFAVGDLVVVTRNDHLRGLLNGTRAILTDVGAAELTMRTEDDVRVAVPTDWAGERLEHGYALTVHKAQGLTTNVALLHGTGALCQQACYVALSRGRVENHLFTSLPSLVPRPDAELDVPRFALLDGSDPGDVLDVLRQRLSRGRRHTMASHQRPAPAPFPSPAGALGRQPPRARRSDDVGIAR